MNTISIRDIVGGCVGAALALVASWGLGIGMPAAAPHTMGTDGMHQMPDGTMMMNDGSPVPSGHSMSMQGMMMDMTANLVGKTGDELDKAFLEDMVVHHQGAVDMSKELLKRTQRPELIQFANDIISLQTKEIDMQKEWLAEWFD